MRDTFTKEEKIYVGLCICFKTVNGMEACVTFAIWKAISKNCLAQFQNRKRYGSMRDGNSRLKQRPLELSRFKTVNGMEACVTSLDYASNPDRWQKGFKTVNGMEACVTSC